MIERPAVLFMTAGIAARMFHGLRMAIGAANGCGLPRSGSRPRRRPPRSAANGRAMSS